jgi:hypothetical protein
MVRKFQPIGFLPFFFTLLTACSLYEGTPPTAIVPSRIATIAPVINSNSTPPTATPTIPEMTVDSRVTLSAQYKLTIRDNGRIFTFSVTSRFLLYLDKTLYPKNEQICQPDGIASWVSNAMGLYDEKLKLDSVGFETVKPGVCVIQVRDFRVVIQVVL